ncbi:MAG: DUF3800 domain-containing protein [Proteobacteria bacterium]|nr:DUF3800 domain-containing protein [Pseudomonadota bacterium]
MYLLYYDEVKYDPPNQDSFWLGGVCVEHSLVMEIENQLNEISQEAFTSPVLSKETEFHGIDVCRGKGNFKGFEFEDRMEILEKLLAVLARDEIKRIYVRILPANIVKTGDPPEEIAFMYLVENADLIFKENDSYGMLFGDYDEPAIGVSVTNLSHFRRRGTAWAGARDIENIIDTVHFAKSHHSRMIQLADIYVYCLQFHHKKNKSNWRREVHRIILESGILNSTKSRIWPVEAHWYR